MENIVNAPSMTPGEKSTLYSNEYHTISAKTLWTKYQITLHCYIFDPPCPPFNVEVKNCYAKCCTQNQQHCLGWGEGGSCFI